MRWPWSGTDSRQLTIWLLTPFLIPLTPFLIPESHDPGDDGRLHAADLIPYDFNFRTTAGQRCIILVFIILTARFKVQSAE